MNIEVILQILQTIGICIGSIALVLIAILAWFMWTTMVPPTELEEYNDS